jgi:translation initiation factor 2B subunit (eIF-2B alpha/beta/delta family)
VGLFSDKIREIEFDRSSGASEIARNALGVLRFFAQESRDESCRDFVEGFRAVGRRLFEARPNMAPVQNLVAQIVYEVNALKADDSVREFAMSRIDELCSQSVDAVKESAGWGATLIGDFDCVTSCSYSSTVCETFRMAKQQGKNFSVYVAESKSENGRFRYGQALATVLESIDVPAEVFPDKEEYRYIPKTKRVLVGADSVLCDGSFVNGSPTYAVAAKAKEYGIPVYSVCETTKVNIPNYLGKKVELKKGFDLVPSNLVTGIVTEKGILDANKLAEVMKEKTKYFKIFHIK